MATRLSDPTALIKACANCGKQNSPFACGGCKIEVVGQFSVVYCSKTCQVSHWEAHKLICGSRKRLGRAVSIVHELYTAFEEATFDRTTVLRHEKGNVIYTTQDADDRDIQAVIGKSIIRTFPDEVAPPGTRDEILRAILFDSQCDTLGDIGMPLVKLFIKRKLPSLL